MVSVLCSLVELRFSCDYFLVALVTTKSSASKVKARTLLFPDFMHALVLMSIRMTDIIRGWKTVL